MSTDERIGWSCVALAFVLFADLYARGIDSCYGRLFVWLCGGKFF